MKIPIRALARFAVRATPQTAFALLADVPRSARHFPEVESLEDEGGGVYRWRLEPVGALGIRHQVVYACRYTADASTLSVQWTPVAGGNGTIRGHWRLAARAGGTLIDFATSGELEIPIPAWLGAPARSFVAAEFRRQIDRYHENLKRSLGG
ncbi:MAG: SRPBCC family protein [Nevskia sp.]|nr:SRPBCC family protein [Nevskia sp.]